MDTLLSSRTLWSPQHRQRLLAQQFQSGLCFCLGIRAELECTPAIDNHFSLIFCFFEPEKVRAVSIFGSIREGFLRLLADPKGLKQWNRSATPRILGTERFVPTGKQPLVSHQLQGSIGQHHDGRFPKPIAPTNGRGLPNRSLSN